MHQQYLKVGLVVPQIKLGQALTNAKEIIRITREDKLADILLFPELTITGYSIGDWMFNRQLLSNNLEALQYILDHNDDHILILGTLLEWHGSIYNVGLVIEGNKIVGMIPKQFLPRSKEFSDPRFFASGQNLIHEANEIEILGQKVPIGELLFQVEQGAFTFAVEVCGDLWAPISPSATLYTKGAEIIFNLSASTYNINKHDQRLLLTQSASLKGLGAYVYVSTGVSETSSDYIYTGHQIVCESGDIILNVENLDFESSIQYADIDLEKIKFERISSGWLHDFNPGKIRTISVAAPKRTDFRLSTLPSATPFVPQTLHKTNSIIEVISAALKKRLQYVGTNRVVIGVSGGLDSTLALLLAYETFRRYSLDIQNIYAFTLPALATGSKSKEIALSLMKKLGVSSESLLVGDEVKDHLQLIGHDGVTEDVTYENAQARYRTMVLMNKANQLNAIVLGTSDMSEIALGWSTFNGDHMAMYGLNAGLPKTTVQHLVRHFRTLYPEIEAELTAVLEADITPELVSNNQKTEDKIGKYLINDFILYHLMIRGASKSRIVYLLGEVFKLTVNDASDYYDNFITRFKRQQYKRLTSPESVKIFETSLSPRSDVKLPGDLY